ncbi:MAG: EamA family transporter RarD [Alphaproteobacteria bacterium]|nr:EamA family transporter RarD [Alphaproteobacteria bacterium]
MSEAAAPLTSSPSEAERRAGFLSAASAYVIWGFLPLYLKLLHTVDVREVLAQRILWAAPSALLAVFLMSGWRVGLREIATALKPRMIGTLAVSACFIFVNWGLYVYLVLHERIVESALAYFLAPLVAVGVGVLFFGEKIRTPQIVALALALIGVVVQGFALGAPPWMALALCATWSAYAVIRKRAPVPAAVGLLIESLALMPLVVGLLWWASSEAPLSFTSDWSMALLLAIAGPVTAIPLMAFAFGARRVSFTTLGLLQFLAPTLQFSTGLAFGEPFTPLRAASFVLIWLGLAFFAWDTLRRARQA